ncbi:TM2 domain-containing protein [Agrococcus sp. HG114]|uniref:TM2 domain-containing protein n=1 Tax=Agrococcus sp. HG114 TaxID=2969757 RepID=UPI00215B0024|nr:TM2 domain-containing protein [Agrococcus sp. HG114]MCR8669553.1 NINE protein [Agrococcus sp. HG114]
MSYTNPSQGSGPAPAGGSMPPQPAPQYAAPGTAPTATAPVAGYPPAAGYASAPAFNGPQAPLKSFVATWLFAMLLGVLGVDRFYFGKVGTGIAKLLTFGGLGIWALVDLIITLVGKQTDKLGRPLEGYEQHKKTAWIVTAAWVLLGVVVGAVNGATAGSRVPAALPEVSQSAPEPAAEVEDAAEPAAPAEEPADEPAAPVEAPVDDAASWAADTYGTFDAVTQQGSGDSIIELPAGAGIVTASHNGSANFIVQVLDASNGMTGDLLVNTIGAYSGTAAYGITAFGEGARLQVTADGAWELTIAPIASAPELAESGAGDGVFLYGGDAAAATLTHDGSANFIVQQHSDGFLAMGLLVNDIGAYSGTVPLGAGPSVVTVMADGSWTISLP